MTAVKQMALGIGLVLGLVIVGASSIEIGGVPWGGIVGAIVWWIGIIIWTVVDRWRIHRDVRRYYKNCTCMRDGPPSLTCISWRYVWFWLTHQ